MTQPRCVFKSRLFRLHLPLIFNKAVNVSLNKQVKFIRIYSCTEIWWYHVRPHGDLQSRGQIVAGEISAHVQWGLNKHHSEKSVVVLWGYWPELLETAVSQLALGFQCRRVLLHIWSSRKGCLISYLPCKASLSYEKKILICSTLHSLTLMKLRRDFPTLCLWSLHASKKFFIHTCTILLYQFPPA